ncbi:MAG TPA: sulfite exporter TauE/SafE family protein [Thermomicrobiales bacterium]|nr:sulfite exporter TauE/SafE family protein [Thermomicrobiales bacterium]
MSFLDIPYDTTTVVAIALIVYAMTALSAIAGFGFGTVAVPMLLLVLPPAATVAVVKVVGTGTGWIVLLSIWRRIQWLTVVKILPAALVGLVFGGYILKTSRPSTIQLIVGVLVLFSAATLVVRPILIENDAIWSTSLIGFLTGVMGNATGLLAPAVVVYFTGRQFPKDVFRATTLSLFLIIELVRLPTLLLQGAITLEDIRFALLLVPAAVAGRLSGLRLVRYVPAAQFRALVIALLFVMATTSILSGAQGLIR